MDEQEKRERETAAQAYAGEDEQLFVDYAQDCINHSVKEHRELRQTMSECYSVFKEEEPASYAHKEAWQSRIVVPKPFASVQFGAAAVKKAFSPNFLTVKNEQDEKAGKFWQKVMEHYLSKEQGNFPIQFSDATTMALAVGKSMEIIPRWVPGHGLRFSLIEPWKIQRDPDALPRDPQSGLYWIHQEWLDYFVLKQGETDGRYYDVARSKDVTSENSEDPFMSKEAIKARKKQMFSRSDFRTAILTSEFYGQVLSKNGELLLPSGTFTIAGGRLIQAPRAPSYRTLRWPGIDFTPLPDLLYHGGRGLLEGVMSVWEAWNQIISMHQDYMQWIVNPPREITQKALVNIDDVDVVPGKTILVKETQNGQSVVRMVSARSKTNDVLANSGHFDQLFQRGSLVTDGVQGLPGYRKDITFRESAMNLDSAMGVFGLMGDNLEDGAGWAIRASADIIESQIGYQDLLDIFSEEELKDYGIDPNEQAETGVTGIPPFSGSFHVSGIQALLRDAETLKNLREIVIPLSDNPRYAPYIRPLKVLRSIEKRTGMEDEGVFATKEEARVIDIQAQLAAAGQKKAMERLQEMQEAMGMAELMEKLDGLENNEVDQMAKAILAMTGADAEKRPGAPNSSPNNSLDNRPASGET